MMGITLLLNRLGVFGSDALRETVYFTLKSAVTVIMLPLVRGILLWVGRRRFVGVVMLVMRRFCICLVRWWMFGHVARDEEWVCFLPMVG